MKKAYLLLSIHSLLQIEIHFICNTIVEKARISRLLMNIIGIYAKVIPYQSNNCVAQPLLLLLLFPKPTTSKLNARIDPVTLNKSSSN